MYSGEIDPQQLKSIENRFTLLSEQRLSRMLDGFNYSQADIIQLIPLLFHLNHPMLPGYLDKSTPCSVANFYPSKLQQQLAKGISRSFHYQPRAHRKFDIAGLYIMGSNGTLGQAHQSDLDLWVCIAKPLSQIDENKLHKKISFISQWMKTNKIELNAYLVYEDDFVTYKNKNLGADNCGNTQNFLLLDEFYRTAIWLAGRKPLWWLVPPEQNYAEYTNRLFKEKYLTPLDWLNFGNIETIPVEEYFSASLWHLYKATESPYKSFVKLLLLEIYARCKSKQQMLSHKYKSAIYQGTTDINQLDPYLMLLECAEDFLQGETERLDFFRRAFYLKSKCKINLTQKNSKNWRYNSLFNLVKKWQWKQPRLQNLNNRANWKIDQVKKERQDLIKALFQSYENLSIFSQQQNLLNKNYATELKVLSNKFTSVFNSAKGKLSLVNHGISKNLLENEVTIYQHNGQWKIYRGIIDKKQINIHQYFYHAENFFSLIAWCCKNGIVNQNTQFRIFSNNTIYLSMQLKKLTNSLIKQINKPINILQENFQFPATISDIAIFFNTLKNPISGKNEQQDYTIYDSDDIFSWGDKSIHLITQFNLCITNSWGETYVKNYQGELAWFKFIYDYRAFYYDDKLTIDKFTFYFGQTAKNDRASKRLIQLSEKFYQLLLLSKNTLADQQYSIKIGKDYLLIIFSNGQVSYKKFNHQSQLSDALDYVGRQSLENHIDPWLKLPDLNAQ